MACGYQAMTFCLEIIKCVDSQGDSLMFCVISLNNPLTSGSILSREVKLDRRIAC